MNAKCAQSLQLCPTLCNPMKKLARLLCPWDSPGKNAGVGCHCLPPEDLPNLRTEPASPASTILWTDSLPLSHCGI